MAAENPKTTSSKAQSNLEHSDANSVWKTEHEALMPPDNRKRIPRSPQFEWSLSSQGNHISIMSLFVSVLTWLFMLFVLAWNAGWIVHPAKETTVYDLSKQIVAIDESVQDLKTDVKQQNTAMVKLTESVARIAGYLEAMIQPPSIERPRRKDGQ